jgi:hypothetical protein
MYRIVDKAELVVIPKTDHFTMAVHFNIVSMILMGFLKRVIGSY